MIAREQVTDLQPGDVVELRHRLFPEVTLRGPLSASGSLDYDLVLPPVYVRERSGEPGKDMKMWDSLTVVSRAPRRVYVNHPRSEPTSGDVAQVLDGVGVAFHMYGRDGGNGSCLGWFWPNGRKARVGESRLRLLVDGETGQVVQ